MREQGQSMNGVHRFQPSFRFRSGIRGYALPLAVLAGLLVFCLWHGHAVEESTALWIQSLDKTARLAQEGAWEEAAGCLEESYRDWHRARTWLQMVARHDGEDTAEDLYRRCIILIRFRDPDALAPELASLRIRLELIAQMERPTWGNLL